MKGVRRLLLAAAVLVRPASAEEPVGAPPAAPASLSSIDRHIADLDAQEQTDKAELEHLGDDLGRTHARLVEHGKLYYRLTRAGLLPMGGGFLALVSYAMRVERIGRMVASDVHEERREHDHATDLGGEIDRIERDKSALAVQHRAMESARLAADDERRRQTEFEHAFQTSTGAGSDYVAVYGAAGGVSPEMPAGGFASARGRLLFPVSGRAEARPVHREGTGGPGLEILAPAGSVVRAVFAARVAFADRYGPYGRIVILDHGDHYYTISGNLDAIDVKIGQDVGAGDRLGTVGDGGSGPMLYFEVRHGSQAVPPAPWLGI